MSVTGALTAPVTQAVEPVTISGTVWRDTNANGLRDAGEPGAAGVAMGVVKPNGSLAASGYTAADGSYHFDGIAPGTYHVEMLVPQDQTLVRPDAGDDANDSDLNWIDGASAELQCPGGDCGAVDAGLVDRQMDISVSATPKDITLPPGTTTDLKIVIRNTGNVPVPKPRVTGKFTSAGPGNGTGPGWTCSSKAEWYFCGEADLLEPGGATAELSLPVTVPANPDVVNLVSTENDDIDPGDNEVAVPVTPGAGL